VTDRLDHAFQAFATQLGSVGWAALAIAVGCHLLKMVARTKAWRNILAAAYPRATVRWRDVFGAYAAGAAVNAIVPARGGDALKLYLTRRQIAGSEYPTLVATLAVETLVDLVLSTALFLWALHQHVLPGLDALARLRSIDWSWVERDRRLALGVGIAVLVFLIAAFVWARPRLRDLSAKLRAGGAILRRPRQYLRGVVLWQLLDWTLRLATVYWLLRAFGLPATVHNALLVQVTQSLSTLVPLSPGGVGTEQGLLAYVFSGKASAATVLSFSVGMKVALTCVNLAVGFTAIALMLRTLRWRRALTEREPQLLE
jgi:uncharacterized membrane protein YbhN (UPF0104 family)